MPTDGQRRRLVLVSLALFAYELAAGTIAAWQDWPAELGTTAADDPESAMDWIVDGSLIHAPLPVLVAQLVLTGLLLLPRRAWLLTGAIGLTLVGIVYVIGYVGEPPLHPERSDPPVLAYVLVRVPGAALVLTLLALAATAAARELRRRQAADVPPAAADQG